MEPARPVRAFFLYRDSPLRRQALALEPAAPERYSLYGLDEVAAAGVEVGHNLEPHLRPGRVAAASGAVLDRVVRVTGGYSGDFPGVLASLGAVRDADVAFSTVDTVGIPLALLAGARVVRTPVVYVSIGLPERLEQLRTRIARRRFRHAFRRLDTIVAYGHGEAEALRSWLGEEGTRIVFVPFGVDTDAFRPVAVRVVDIDVVSIGADPRRDFRLLVELARRLPHRSFRVAASSAHRASFADAPANLAAEYDVPFGSVPELLARGRVVVLPVRDNSYSGATTTLLQAMAVARPVVVTRTAAIARGYHLEHDLNCVLVSPGDLPALEHAVESVLGDLGRAAGMGARARETVERHLTWARYASTIHELLVDAASRAPGGATEA